MDEHVVMSVAEQTSADGADWWVVRFRHGDGSEREHFIPKVALDARAAEYGIEPTDVDTLLDVLFAEPFIPDPTLPANHAADAAAKAGFKAKAIKGRDAGKAGQQVPAWLFNAATVDEARAAHLARVAAVRTDLVKIAKPVRGARAVADPLDVIRNGHKPDPKFRRDIAESVNRERRRLRGERPDKEPTP